MQRLFVRRILVCPIRTPSSAKVLSSPRGAATRSLSLRHQELCRPVFASQLAQIDAAPAAESTSSSSLWLLLGFASLSSLVVGLKTRCDEEATNSSAQSNSDDVGGEEGEGDDPYANLPENDEETTCSMCNTFRKGPCRPYWRKLERCFKDHDQEENGAVKCMRYFKPHQSCLMDYTNLYQLISLELKQELVRDIELSTTEQERRSWHPDIDWKLWIQFSKEAGLKFREAIQSVDDSGELLPLWKRLPENREPVLLTIPAPLPKVDKDSGMILKIAYVIDQDGFVLGLTYNKGYGELSERAEAKASGKELKEDDKQKTATSSENQPEETSKAVDDGLFDFDFFVLPGETKRVQICALYSENPMTASPEKDILDALLFKSDPYDLHQIAVQAQ